MSRPLRLVVFGLSLSSSWGNGHATTYRALLEAFARRGHSVLFLERDQPWYAANRDLVDPGYCRLVLYDDLAALGAFSDAVIEADAVVVGSYVPDGIAVGRMVQSLASGVTAFYDIDTPVTLAKLDAGGCDYLAPELVPGYHLYLSFAGGPTLDRLERDYGARAARPLYCSVDTDAYRPAAMSPAYDLGYLGTYSPDRQPALERLLIEPARRAPHLRFVVAGPLYPADIAWPANVDYLPHVAPADHPRFYGNCRFTLNLTRADMMRAGHSPSVRLFEAAACGTPILSDHWNGIETILRPDREVAIVDSAEDVLAALTGWPEARRAGMAAAARARVLQQHSAERRASELETHLVAARAAFGAKRAVTAAGSRQFSGHRPPGERARQVERNLEAGRAVDA